MNWSEAYIEWVEGQKLPITATASVVFKAGFEAGKADQAGDVTASADVPEEEEACYWVYDSADTAIPWGGWNTSTEAIQWCKAQNQFPDVKPLTWAQAVEQQKRYPKDFFIVRTGGKSEEGGYLIYDPFDRHVRDKCGWFLCNSHDHRMRYAEAKEYLACHRKFREKYLLVRVV